MTDFTESGRQTVREIASRYGLPVQAVEQMARAVSAGGGSMAQFNIPELGGNGQWMAGGMTMVGDMFNYGLQSTVTNLCTELANAMSGGQFFKRPQTTAGSAWWPEDLGQPSSVGGQNQTRYAYFPQARRIAFDPGNGQALILLDTLDHQIGGFSQQQSGPGDPFVGITFSSQFGQFALSSLPRVDASGGSGGGQTAAAGNSQSASSPQGFTGQRPSQQQSQSHGSQQQRQGNPSQQAYGSSQQQSQGGWQPQSYGSQQQNQGSWQSEPVQDWQQTPPASSEAEEPQGKSDETPSIPTPETRGGNGPSVPSTASAMDLLAVLERLAALRDAGAITAEEYDKKKAELLARI